MKAVAGHPEWAIRWEFGMGAMIRLFTAQRSKRDDSTWDCRDAVTDTAGRLRALQVSITQFFSRACCTCQRTYLINSGETK
jgi:hypothetical protein